MGSYPHLDWPIDLFRPAVEPVDTIVSGAKKALPFIDKERVVLAPDCGMKYLPRDVSLQKLRNMAAGAALLRAEFTA